MKRLSIKLKITLWYIWVMIIISGVVFTACLLYTSAMRIFYLANGDVKCPVTVRRWG